MTDRVLAVLGTGLVDACQPVLRADDLGVLRGDGIFETLLVRHSQAWLLDDHLQRLAGSAVRMDLAVASSDELRDLVATALGAWPAEREGVLRLVCTRGPEGGGPPTVYAAVAPVPAEILRQRAAGVRVLTRPLGLSADLRSAAPWLLGGVKTISYAVAMAVLRDARRQGADDVIWLSVEGEVLEGPTASVVWAVGDTLHTIPADTGILEGTTVAHLMAEAPRHGFATATRRASIDDLRAADGVWLLSSVRGAAAVREIDGAESADTGLTGRILTALGLD
ncbi:MAG: aminotransferase class IV [Actinomycetota bacterium]|nr:aminotransferase class IV [Actinomycetota bacterium]